MAQPDTELLLRSARDALEDTYTLQGVRARQPRLPSGGYHWSWRGPRDDPEWAWFFNRHHWLPALHFAHRALGDPRHLDLLLATLDDWIAAHPPPGRMTFSPAWRPLEAARRLLSSWLPLWPLLLQEPAFDALRRERLAASLRDHGRHLRRHHAFGGNHLVTEMLALARLALFLPGEPAAADWLAYALRRLDHAHAAQVYPDGTYKELSSHYHRIVADNFAALRDALVAAGRHDLAEPWTARVDRLRRALRDLATPSGHNPLDNDSDEEDLRELVAAYPAAASRHFPSAGRTVFRAHPASGGEHAAWFDAGPRGSDHDHADLLSFACSLGHADFLTDNGRHTYRPGPWRDYFAGPSGHNVLLLDGLGSDQGPAVVSAPPRVPRYATCPGLELAWGDAVFALDGNPRAADWRRLVLHFPGLGWAVLDRLVGFSPRRLETLWHWRPAVTLSATPDPAAGLIAHHPAGPDLRVRLFSDLPAATELVTGRGLPSPQGWFSPAFNHREPAPALLVRQSVHAPLLNVWLFQPADAPTLTAALLPGLRVSLGVPDRDEPLVIDPEHPTRGLC